MAKATLNELGPADLAAVVYTENNHTAQNFTTDRKRLLAAIETSAIFPATRFSLRPVEGVTNDLTPLANDPFGNRRGSCQCGVCSIEALGHVSEALRSLPQQRKIVVYISPGVVVMPDTPDTPERICNLERRTVMNDVFRQAAISNVTIQAVDPKGFIVGQVGGDLKTNATFLRVEFLRTMAETTGGRAVVNNNEMEQEVPAVLAESSAYYLLGVVTPATKDDGRFHPIQVHVNRPGVETRTRNGYYTPTAKERKAMAANASRDLDAAVAGALPKSAFPMEVAIAPFASGSRKTELVVVGAVSHPTNAFSQTGNRAEPVDVLLSVFNPETGKSLGSWRQKLNLVWNATNSSSGLYEVLSRVPVATGRYELRLGVKIGDGRAASVYGYVEVPNFAGDDLSLSGLVVSATPSPRQASKETAADLMPFAPTARRTFRRADRVAVFLRVYQGGSHALVPAAITTRIIDATNKQVGDGFWSAAPTSFTKSRSFDYRFDLPVRDLSAGEYLLTVDVAAERNHAQRAVRFRVQ